MLNFNDLWKNLSSSEFEQLALDYAKNKYENYDWKSTKTTSDDNHDFYYEELDELKFIWEGWGEAKHSKSNKSTMSKSKWDQTIISAKLSNNVNFLMFVTNAVIPFKYILRAETLKRPPFQKFEYINNIVIENWLFDNENIFNNYFKKNLKKYQRTNFNTKYKVFIIDYFSNSSNELKEPKEYSLNKEYLLLFICNSSKNFKIALHMDKDIEYYPYSKVVDNDSIVIKYGINIFKFVVKFNKIKQSIKFKISDNDRNVIKTINKKVSIINQFVPSLQFSEQIKLLNELTDIINSNNSISKNSLITIHSKKGIGKTYLFDLIYKNLKNNYNFIKLSFFDDEKDCACTICNLFLTINFGSDYKLKGFSDTLYKCTNKKMPKNILKQIFLGSDTGNVFEAETSCNYLIDYMVNKRNKANILPNSLCYKSIILIDDIHKTPNKYYELLKCIITNFLENNSNSFMLTACRKNEFNSYNLQDFLIKKRNESKELKEMKFYEKKFSLKANFKFINQDKYIDKALEKCNSTFLFINLLCKINFFKENYGENEIELNKHIFKIMSDIINSSKDYYKNDFLSNEKFFDIIYPVYSFDSGINKSFLLKIENSAQKIELLCKKNIIKIENDFIYPSHDIFREVFNDIYEMEKYYKYKEDLIKICHENYNSTLDKYKLIYVLLKFSDAKNTRTIEIAEKMVEDFFCNTEYGKLYVLIDWVLKVKNINIYSLIDNYDDLKLLYICADTYDHMGLLKQADEIFKYVYICGKEISDNPPGFVFDSKAQIFNLEFACLRCRNTILNIDEFLIENEEFFLKTTDNTVTNARLVAINRKMVIELCLDNINAANKTYIEYNTLINEKGDKNHEAYILIDYARGIYHADIKSAYSKMSLANKLFKKIPEQKRRQIDSDIELAFLEFIIKNKGIENLISASEKAYDDGFSQIYKHSLLKIAACQIVLGNIIDAENTLSKFVDKYDILDGSNIRSAMIFYELNSALSFLKGRIDDSLNYQKMKNEIASKIGISYINKNKINEITCRLVSFNCYDNDCYSIDTRIW